MAVLYKMFKPFGGIGTASTTQLTPVSRSLAVRVKMLEDRGWVSKMVVT